MNPIYFPYTYISPEVAEAVAACCGRFTVYQPLADRLPQSMQACVDNGLVDIRTPAAGDDKALVSAVKNYLNWANAHTDSSGHNIASLKTLHASAMPSGDTLSSIIVADVKKQMNGTADRKPPDSVLAARIFLYFAQEFDRQSQELDHVMAEFSQKEQALIQDLKMEDDALAAELNKKTVRRPDGGTDYLIPARLEAWSRILIRDKEPVGLFVTTSAAVLEHLLDGAPAAQKILKLGAIPRLTPATMAPAEWQQHFFSYLAGIVKNKWTPDSVMQANEFDIPAAENTVSLKVYIIPEQNFRQFFCHSAGIKGSESNGIQPIVSARNTLIALIEA
jgi:hypothetical protein